MTPAFRRKIATRVKGLTPGVLALGAMAILSLAVVFRPLFLASEEQNVLQATSYSKLVRNLVEQGFIVANPLEIDGAIETQVSMTEDALADPAVNAFRFGSSLRTDLTATDGRWKMSDGQLEGIDPRIHSLRSPFARPRLWTGDIRFTAEPGADSKGLWLVSSTGLRKALRRGPNTSDEAGLVDVLSGKTRGDISRGFEFAFAIDDEPQTVGFLSMIEEHPVLSLNCNGSAGIRVALISPTLPANPCDQTRARRQFITPLSTGDTIAFARSSGEARGTLFTVISQSSGLSRYEPFAGRISSELSLDGLAVQIADAMNQQVAGSASGSSRRTSSDTNIQLSIRADIQTKLDQDFQSFLAGYTEVLGRETAPLGSVAILNALSGEILGLGSQSPPRRSTTAVPRNQAFVPMSAGSTAKMPVSAAILAQHPALALLCAPTSYEEDGFDRVLGLRLESYNTDTVRGGGLIGFEEYLQRSSNRYAATLLMLASTQAETSNATEFRPENGGRSTTLPAQDRYGFASSSAGPCGSANMISRRPKFRFQFMPPDEEGARPDQLRAAGDVTATLGPDAWPSQLRNLFDMPAIIPSANAELYDTSIWSSLVRNEQDQAHFVEVSPEREDFRLGEIDNLRADYLPIILGGGQARWSAVKLAESYGRIVSGMRVPMTIVAVGSRQPDTAKPLKALSDSSRAALINGLRRVVTRGTGRKLMPLEKALNARSASGTTYRIFAKTGTPSIRKPARTPINELANDLINAGVIAKVSTGTIGVLGQSDNSPAEALERGHRNAARSWELTAKRKTSLLNWIELTNERIANGRESHLRFRTDGSISLSSNTWKVLGKNETDEGGVLAMVVARYCGANAADDVPKGPPAGAIAIAVNIAAREGNGRQSGSNPALDFIRNSGLLSPGSAVIRELNDHSARSKSCES